VDAVILAAGRRRRVESITGPYGKPLIKVDGVSLVRRAVLLAREVRAERIVVVVAPQNAAVIIREVEDVPYVNFVLQPSPRGPGHALLYGIASCNSEDDRVLVLLGDNLSTNDDVQRVVDNEHGTAIGVRMLNVEDAQRYTFLDYDNVWREKEPPRTDQLLVPCWIGPFVGCIGNIYAELNNLAYFLEPGQELPIGPYLNRFMWGGRTRTVLVGSRDLGTPEALAEIIRDEAQ
jgi:molybdopterin-guanine dinucleotide biosynthesis protein A